MFPQVEERNRDRLPPVPELDFERAIVFELQALILFCQIA
jgi:hypothetical protein